MKKMKLIHEKNWKYKDVLASDESSYQIQPERKKLNKQQPLNSDQN